MSDNLTEATTAAPSEPQSFVLTLSCSDEIGIIAAVTGEISSIGGNILESNQYCDKQSNRLFMRISFETPHSFHREKVERLLQPTIDRFGMKTSIVDLSRKRRIIIMVSKFDHALLHLLYQYRVGWLNVDVVAIVSNHDTCAKIAEDANIPYYLWPVSRENKTEQERKLIELVNDTGADLVVLARYMQVLSNEASNRLFGKVINIHHSFLPSFKGAKPYHQAHERGVKLIGATAHYVTADLDEGPIIEQETEPVTHSMSPDDFVAAGREIESRVLAKAVKNHLESRVMLNGHKTIVFAR